MKFTVIQNKSNVLTRLDGDPRSYFNPDAAARNQICWIDIATNDRKDLDDILAPLVESRSLLSHLESPGESTRVRVYNDILFLDLHAFPDHDDLRSSYFSMVIAEDRVIVISQDSTEYFSEMMDRWKNMSTDGLTPLSMLFCFFDFLLDKNTKVINQLNFKVGVNSKALMGKRIRRDFLTFDQLRNEVMLVQEVLEDQFTSFGLLPIHMKRRDEKNVVLLEKLVSAIEHLQRVAERLEDKLDNQHDKYLYDLQNETNRRINTLTILQSIFVPLTFIAGIYGMNFPNMPEFTWGSGYFYALGLMGVMAAGEVFLFYRMGWFK